MKILKWLLIGLITLVIVGGLGLFWFFKSSQPVYDGEIMLSGLHGDVIIYFDNFGVPHIYANDEEDLYFALGYVHAQDRLFQMELLRRVGGGRLSEILGPDLINTDRFLRTIGLNEIAEQSAREFLSENQAPFQKAALSYLKGLNSFIENGPDPPEFAMLGIPKEPFTTADLYRIVGYIGFNFNTAVRTDPLLSAIASQLGPSYIRDLIINSAEENTTIPTHMMDSTSYLSIASSAIEILNTLPVPEWMGSNSWVVAPHKTKSGFPMFSNDAHIGFSQPSVWYEAHLNAPGFNFYGNHLAGFPFALIGHNDALTWGLTIFPNDDMDFYREKSDPQQPERLWYKDHWETMQTRKEIIQVKGGDQVEFDVKSSRHGPIINAVNPLIDSLEQQPVSFFWTYLKFPSKALQTAYGMAHSRNMDEFASAISMLEAPGLNITYADVEGNIAWWAVARLVNRPEHVEPKMLLDGSSGLDDPLGWYPFSENPRSINPPEGFVYSANNQPDSAFGVFHPGYYYPGDRGKRIIELLTEKSDWDLESFKKMILDDRSPSFPENAKQILALLDEELNEVELQVKDLLQNWDGRHGLNDIGPTIYYKLTNCIMEQTFLDELGAENYRVFTTTLVARRSLSQLIANDSSIWWNDVDTEDLETRESIINSSFRESVNQLIDELGPDPTKWHWSRVHLLEHVHAIGRQKPFNRIFNVGPFSISGGDEVINKMDFNKTSTPYMVRSGASMRILIDLADLANSVSIIPTGQSGHVMSKHYQDQAPLYNEGKFRPQHMDKHLIEGLESEPLLLRPASD